jgi:hypothetical protein
MEIDINYKDIYFTLDLIQILFLVFILVFFIYGIATFIFKIYRRLFNKKYKSQQSV